MCKQQIPNINLINIDSNQPIIEDNIMVDNIMVDNIMNPFNIEINNIINFINNITITSVNVSLLDFNEEHDIDYDFSWSITDLD